MMRRRAELTAWIAGLVGIVGSIAGWLIDPDAFAFGWLAAVILVVGWPLGSIALIHIHALTGGRWGWAIHPQLAFGTAALAVVLFAIIPIALLAGRVYPWMHPDAAKGLLNTWYLNPGFFYGRGIGYAVVWLAIGAITLLALRRTDPQPMLYRIAAPCLILLELSVTFAAIDSTLSLEPEFKSSVYGMLMSAEGVLFALSLATFAALLIAPLEPKPREDLGKLMLALTIFWAYLDFMQILVIWNSDLPEEAAWYVHRINSGWAWIAGLIALLHFFVPFFVLLWPQMQRSRRVLAVVATVLVVAEIPRAWWLVLPSFPRGFNWVDIVTMLAVLGLAAGVTLSAPRFALVSKAARQTHA
jgi:hypothetical protein